MKYIKSTGMMLMLLGGAMADSRDLRYPIVVLVVGMILALITLPSAQEASDDQGI